MRCLDLTWPTPEENLACDEALLDLCEAGGTAELLRFWEASQPFVAVGYANKVAAEVNQAACVAAGIPILRRCTGGGTVVQGPGCLSYSLILRIDESGPTASVNSSNLFVMRKNQRAIQQLLASNDTPLIERSALSVSNSPERNSPPLLKRSSTLPQSESSVEILGHTDLALGKIKFSCNAQRRRRHWLLFHGTFLLDFNLELIERLLLMPALQPEYRENRPHRNFVGNLPCPTRAVKNKLRQVWSAQEDVARIPHEAVAKLAAKYARPEWNFKF